MNSAQQAHSNNLRFFFLAIGTAIVLIAASGFFLAKGLDREQGGDPAKSACLAAMRINGFNPKDDGDTLRVRVATTAGLETLVFKSGVLVSNCPTYKLKTYCAGTACASPGVNLVLEKKEP